MVVFIDDILIYSRNDAEHEEHLRIVLKLLLETKLYAKLKKCKFWLQEDAFLSYVISPAGVIVDLKKVDANRDLSRSTTITEVKSFLGLAGYYRRFIEGFVKLSTPLT
ncbi:uncharacterized protein LOC109720340 [Ananas comosus]|uniref:Uncharacterized protein LOC109720340 n=1 Tax=Ananas comosus TaxID=4615 RepID=A0A6P5GCC9_ANACO|nr:uncharacterized protein LOC109720340 [Ananas comosus]